MAEKSLLYTGVCGTCVSGICCVTPLAVIGLTTLGFSSLVGWLDYVLIPSFAGFAALTAYAFWKRRKT
jgi:mercuric ion transport protein